MRKSLLLMRHGKSDWHNDLGDFDRPLNPRGMEDVPNIANALKQQDRVPSRIVSSSACRAKQTTELLCSTLGIVEQQVIWQPDLYLADCHTLLHFAAQHISQIEGPLMLVAHNPGLDELTRLLSIQPPPYSATGKLMTTAAVAIFDLNEDTELAAGHELHMILRPKEL